MIICVSPQEYHGRIILSGQNSSAFNAREKIWNHNSKRPVKVHLHIAMGSLNK